MAVLKGLKMFWKFDIPLLLMSVLFILGVIILIISLRKKEAKKSIVKFLKRKIPLGVMSGVIILLCSSVGIIVLLFLRNQAMIDANPPAVNPPL